MATTTKRAQIMHRHGQQTLLDEKTTLVPNMAELILYEADNEHQYPRVKFGDGTKSLTQLPFLGDPEARTSLATKAPLASPSLTGTPTAPTADEGTNTTQIATTAFVNSAFKTNEAMIMKGTIGSSGATVTSLPASHNKGWTYIVATEGTYAGVECEVGDMIICITTGTSANNAHWKVVETDIHPITDADIDEICI